MSLKLKSFINYFTFERITIFGLKYLSICVPSVTIIVNLKYYYRLFASFDKFIVCFVLEFYILFIVFLSTFYNKSRYKI